MGSRDHIPGVGLAVSPGAWVVHKRWAEQGMLKSFLGVKGMTLMGDGGLEF